MMSPDATHRYQTLVGGNITADVFRAQVIDDIKKTLLVQEERFAVRNILYNGTRVQLDVTIVPSSSSGPLPVQLAQRLLTPDINDQYRLSTGVWLSSSSAWYSFPMYLCPDGVWKETQLQCASSSDNTAFIVAVAVGVGGGVLLVCICLYFIMCRRRKPKKQSSGSNSQNVSKWDVHRRSKRSLTKKSDTGFFDASETAVKSPKSKVTSPASRKRSKAGDKSKAEPDMPADTAADEPPAPPVASPAARAASPSKKDSRATSPAKASISRGDARPLAVNPDEVELQARRGSINGPPISPYPYAPPSPFPAYPFPPHMRPAPLTPMSMGMRPPGPMSPNMGPPATPTGGPMPPSTPSYSQGAPLFIHGSNPSTPTPYRMPSAPGTPQMMMGPRPSPGFYGQPGVFNFQHNPSQSDLRRSSFNSSNSQPGLMRPLDLGPSAMGGRRASGPGPVFPPGGPFFPLSPVPMPPPNASRAASPQRKPSTSVSTTADRG